ncbi:hypothetical protein ACHAQJ_010076 [Trichoderma viride]
MPATAYLRQLQGDITSSQTPYIYPQEENASAEFAATVSNFLNAHKHGKKAWLGLAMMPPTDWVSADDMDRHLSRTWHAIAFGVIAREEKGKVLLIHDYDVKEFPGQDPKRASEVLVNGALKRLYEAIYQRRHVEVWINQRGQEGQGQRIKSLLQKLTEWASHGDRLFTGSQDPRVPDRHYRITAP